MPSNLPETPFNVGEIVPKEPIFFEVGAKNLESLAAILDLLPERWCRVWRMSPGAACAQTSDAIKGCYKVEYERGGAVLLRIVDKKQLDTHLTVRDFLSRMNADKRICIPKMLPGWPKALEPRSWVLAEHFFEGRYPSRCHDDLDAVAQAVADLHTVLQGHPDRRDIRNATEYRDKEIFSHWPDSVFEAAPNVLREEFRQLAHVEPKTNYYESSSGQLLHGDLNVGNLLIARKKGVVFLDFETALFSYGKVELDLAFLFERLCRRGGGVGHIDWTDAGKIWQKYWSVFGENAKIEGATGSIRNALIHRNVKNLCILTMKVFRGDDVSFGEWRKFFVLLMQAQNVPKGF